MNNTKTSMKCQFIDCLNKNEGCYGDYCRKHRKEFLINESIINLDRFTKNIKDYSLDELKKSYVKYIHIKKPVKFKKLDYFNKINEFVDHKEVISSNVSKIIKIQSELRKFIIKKKIKDHGIAYFNKKICSNTEDFYTYECLSKIEDCFFYSYKDTNNKYWGFDLRSLKKLIDMNYSNPYTTQSIPENIKLDIKRIERKLTKKNILVSIDTSLSTNRKIAVKQKCVDLCSQIEYSGLSCNVDWFLNLNMNGLKRLYKELEDIWNYRANLNPLVKRDIAPPNGQLFAMPVSEYNSYNSWIDLFEVLINDLMKILNARTSSDMNLGFMYIIIGLSTVSRSCLQVHYDWIQFVF